MKNKMKIKWKREIKIKSIFSNLNSGLVYDNMLLSCYIILFVSESSISFSVSHDYMTVTCVTSICDFIFLNQWFITQDIMVDYGIYNIATYIVIT